MVEAIQRNSIAMRIIVDAQVEKSVYWQDNDTCLTFKSRPDIISGNIVADLKTCKDVAYKAFQRSCMDYGYFLQASMCKLGLNAHDVDFERFVFICVDKVLAKLCFIHLMNKQSSTALINLNFYQQKFQMKSGIIVG
jgi:hypothetical protein